MEENKSNYDLNLLTDDSFVDNLERKSSSSFGLIEKHFVGKVIHSNDYVELMRGVRFSDVIVPETPILLDWSDIPKLARVYYDWNEKECGRTTKRNTDEDTLLNKSLTRMSKSTVNFMIGVDEHSSLNSLLTIHEENSLSSRSSKSFGFLPSLPNSLATSEECEEQEEDKSARERFDDMYPPQNIIFRHSDTDLIQLRKKGN